MPTFMSQLQKTAKKRPDIIVAYGLEGSGKTSFAAQFPGATFMMSDNETGLLTLMSRGLVPDCPYFPPFSKWVDVMTATNEMIESSDRPQTLVIDVLNGIQTLCFQYVCDTQYDGDWSARGFMNFQNGYKESQKPWRSWMSLLDTLRDRGTRVLMLCHAQIENFRNPEGADYHRYTPEMHKEIWPITKKLADMILFINFATQVQDVDKATKKGKAVGGQNLMYHTRHSAQWDAKNRHGMAPYFMGSGSAEADYAEFVKLAKAGVKSKQETGKDD